MRSDMVDHEFRDDDGRYVKVMFCVSYSANAADSAMAAESVRDNWDAATACGASVCERADLFTEQGRLRCEGEICEQMTEALFGGKDGNRLGTVERVIWKRLLMQ